MKFDKVLLILIIIFTISSAFASYRLDAYSKDQDFMNQYHDRELRGKYVDRMMRYYENFEYLSIIALIYLVYQVWYLFFLGNLDGKLYKIIIYVFVNVIGMLFAIGSHRQIGISKTSIVNSGEISPVLPMLKAYIFIYFAMILSYFIKKSMDRDYLEEVKKVKESKYGSDFKTMTSKINKK